MVRADFDRNLEDLVSELFGLGEMVEKAIVKSMDALQRRDLAIAYEVVAEDDLIDEKRFELEEKCIDLIATQQPLAIDLRTLLAVLHIAVELERMGDYAEGIGKICMIIGEDEPTETPQQLDQMARMGVAMLQRSLKSLISRDKTCSTTPTDSGVVTRCPCSNRVVIPACSSARVIALPPPCTMTGLMPTASMKTTSRATPPRTAESVESMKLPPYLMTNVSPRNRCM